MKNKYLIITAGILLTLVSQINLAAAGVEHYNLPVCNLAVYPFNPDTPEIYKDAAIPFVNFLSESICKARTPYGSSYNQPPIKADNPLKSVTDIDQKNVPYAMHTHTYIDSSLEDDAYYRSYVDKFEIKLENDALSNMDKLNIQCTTPAPGTYSGTGSDLADCNGSVNDTNFYGGVKVDYNSSTGVVTWEFGTVDKNKRPQVWGNNDSDPSDSDNFNEILQSVYGASANLSDYNNVYRRFGPSVSLHTKNNPAEIWSATTTSRILIRNYAIFKANFNAISDKFAKFSNVCSSLGDYTKWCPSPTPAGQGYATFNYGSQEWFWFPIGSVVSVWQKKVTPPPSPLACADLQWDGAFLKKVTDGSYKPDAINPNALLESEAAIMKFKTIYQTGLGTVRPLEYRWVSFNGETDRPTWFKNDDTLFVGPIYIPIILPLTVTLPGKILTVAHALTPLSELEPIIPKFIYTIGKFKDEVTDTLSGNPITDDDFQAWFSGASEGTTLGVQAFYTDGKNITGQGAMVDTSGGIKQKAEKCHLELKVLPSPPPPSICKILVVKFFDALSGAEVAKDKLTAGKKYRVEIDKANSQKDDGTLISKFNIRLNNSAGPGAYGKLDPNSGNPAGCSAVTGAAGTIGTDSTSVNCKYDYTPNGGDKIRIEADPSDGKALCVVEQIIPIVPPSECQILKVKFFDGALEVAKEAMVAGKTYLIQIDKANSKKTDGSLITQFDLQLYNSGSKFDYGTLVPDAANPATCSAIYSVTPGIIKSSPTSVDCKYVFTPKAGDTIEIEAVPSDAKTACKVKQTIPAIPTTPICKDLNLVTSLGSSSEFGLNQKISLFAKPVDTLGAPREPVVYTEESDGNFEAAPGNAATCPAVPADSLSKVEFTAPSSCKYSYFSPAIFTGKRKFTVRVQKDDGVPACSEKFELKVSPPEKCLALNLQVNGAFTLSPLLTPGASYSLQASPITTKGTPIISLAWSENGSGQLVGQPSNPAICPAIIDNGTVVTPSFCRYIYAGGVTDTDGFSVKAVPDDANPNCMAKSSSFKPPVVKPFCLYLDLSHNNPDVFTGVSTDLTAVVVMSDGSNYKDKVRFLSNDGKGSFTGGFSPVLDSGTSNFRSSVDGTNSTGKVMFTGGNEGTTGLNVFLADTSVVQSAACQRSLAPVKKPDYKCEKPPTIVRTGNSFTASGGDSDQYCWTVSGSGNPLFTNLLKTATGKTVVLNGDYTNFALHVEDCNPKFKSYCFDDYAKENTPKIEKRISKNSPLYYTNKINYSTKGDATVETVNYSINFTPANVKPGYYLTAKIYDPAFTGKIQGYTTSSDGTKGKKISGTIDFTGIATNVKVSGFTACSATPTPIEKCFTVNSAGYIQLQGITDPTAISIKYSGKLTSGITTKECQLGTACNEQFINQSFVTEMEFCQATVDIKTGKISYTCTPEVKPPTQTCQYFYNDKGDKQPISGSARDCDMPKYTLATNTTIAELVCQYFLTRASGDVFLEDQLKYGIDVSRCYPFKNVSSTIVKPVKPIDGKLIKTGAPDIVKIGHEICSAGQANFDAAYFTKLDSGTRDALKTLFGADLTELSSQICEIGLVPGSDWDKDSIRAAIEQNIGKLTRWESGIPTSTTINGISDFSNGIYYYEGTGGKSTVTINSLNIPEGNGPFTIIIKNADLQINSDIKYTASGATPTDPKAISSLGVIVIDGNVYIDPSVKTLSGAFFVQRSNSGDPASFLNGNVFSGNSSTPNVDSEESLTVYGSMYGNIGPLFEHRISAGDINQDQGAITIRYDQRIIQNPPQGLSDILGNFSQSQVAQ